MNGLSDFEAAVLDKLLAGDEPAFTILREQRKCLRVKKREYSGVGFFIDFEVMPKAPELPMSGPIRFGDVHAEIDGLKHGAGFLLFIDDGRTTMLEGYSEANEIWPKEFSSYRLSYSGLERDFSVFRKGQRTE